MKFRLEVHSCMTVKYKPDIVVRLNYAKVNQRELALPAFDVYEKYRNPKMCTLQLLYSADTAKLSLQLHKYFWRQLGFIHFICDQLLSDCEPFVWNCANFSKRKYKKYFKQLIREMLTPNSTVEERRKFKEETAAQKRLAEIQILLEKEHLWSYFAVLVLFLIVWSMGIYYEIF